MVYIKIIEIEPITKYKYESFERINIKEAYNHLKWLASQIGLNQIKEDMGNHRNFKLINIYYNDLEIIIKIDDIENETQYKIKCYGLTQKTFYDIQKDIISIFGN